LVGYLAVTRRDIQAPQDHAAGFQMSPQLTPGRLRYRG
jgi:hypothetical protein